MTGPLNDLRRPHMARADYMWRGYPVVIDPRLPKIHIGDEVYSYRGHRFWQWLWPLLFRKPFPPSMERGRPIMDSPIYQAQGKLFMSPATWAALKEKVNG